ncbi:MAG TPA: 1-acyl-sn-glycerol-3-phosphate acyltransferase [Gemmatimonadaceae bacterium]|nr:1-acyl-sn-glycerol-3-phosphate acyltransferase [Gemmatimonadaceae bacterium]
MTAPAVHVTPFRREGGLSRVIIPAARVLARYYFRARVVGADRIPDDRPVIYVAKHPQTFLYIETIMLALLTFWDNARPAIRVLEKTGTSIHRTPVLGWVRRNVNAVPATEAHAMAVLAQGESLLIFPGGARELYGARDTLRWQGRTGFARLAIRAGVPVLPFAIAGADHQHLGRISVRGASVWLPPFPLPVRLEYRFGHPIAPPEAGSPEGADPAAFARRVETAVRALIEGRMADG